MKNLALWGLPASGKTKLLSQLYLRQSQFQSEWRIFPANAATQKFVERERRKMVEEREFPMPTKEEAPEEIAYEFAHTTSDRRFHLFTVDLAGERSKLARERCRRQKVFRRLLWFLRKPGHGLSHLWSEVHLPATGGRQWSTRQRAPGS